jgi:MFS family permease
MSAEKKNNGETPAFQEEKKNESKKMHRMWFGVSYNIILLGFVSLFTDVSSEMIVAIFPLYVLSVGGTPIILGIINGVAQTTANLVKGVSGWLSDKLKQRKIFITVGYGVSNIAKPLIGVFPTWPVILGLKFADRFGKGIRTAPRDALIAYYAQMSDKEYTGKAFGVHRSFDTTGAVIGPILASVLILMGWSFPNIIIFSIFPGLIAIAFLFAVKDVKESEIQTVAQKAAAPTNSKITKQFIIGMMILSIMEFASVDAAFIILRASEGMIAQEWIPIIYAGLNVIYLLISPFTGKLSDRIGRKKVIIAGLLMLLTVCILFIFDTGPTPTPFSIMMVIIAFATFGLYMGFVDPVSKALVSDVAGKNKKGRAYGVYYLCVGLLSLPESLLFGWLYEKISFSAAFLYSSILLAILIVIFIKKDIAKINK